MMRFSRFKHFLFISGFFCIGTANVVLAADQITQAELVERINDGTAPFILDVRTPEEFSRGHIQGAVNVPVAELVNRNAELSPLKEKEIVVYCHAGPRAGFATQIMEQAGYSGVRNLEGHMQQWLASGRTVVKPD